MQQLTRDSPWGVLLAGLIAAWAGCQVSDRPATSGTVAPQAVEGEAQAGSQIPVVPVAAPAGPSTNPLQPDRAMEYLQQICEIGPRPTGSEGMARQQQMLVTHFEDLGGQVQFQRFRMAHPLTKQPVPVANLVVQWHPQTKKRILLCVHYDTRPVPDNDAVPPRERGKVFIGANDGASGAALLMELAHFMASLQSNYGVDFLLVDAEEFVFPQTRQRYFVGSEYFARDYVNKQPPHRYHKGAVLDMIGDRQLQIYQDRNSIWWRDTRPVTAEIWSAAKRLGVTEFVHRTHPRMKDPIRDDHLMLRNVGKIPTCEVIDFDYPRYPVNRYWHTDADTPDKCSGQSLAKVGWVVLEWLRTAK